MAAAAEFRRLRAPEEDGQTLAAPPEAALPEIVAANRQRFASIKYDVQGLPLEELAASARRNLLEQAVAYTRKYRDVPPALQMIDSPASTPFLLSGHQPELFHSGVWYKNFVLGRLAREVGGVGIHLLVDSDLCRGASIRVPTGSVERPRLETVLYDKASLEVPYEERIVRDEGTFASFAHRIEALLEPLVTKPLVRTLWPLMRERAGGEANLGLRLAQGRHALEETWGNQTLELPQSAVCRLPEFAWFTAHLLAQLPRFWTAHNDALAAYRQAHRLRNRAQPMPDLAESAGWLEAPFWIWTRDDPRRRGLFARARGDEIEITDRQSTTFVLSLNDATQADRAVEQLAELARRGVKLRTRALSTTLFARLVLSDLFLHGIGGAKYDQVSDWIVEQFFGFRPPEYATVSATLRLPIEHRHGDGAERRQVQQRLRELRYHPERFLERDGLVPEGQSSRVAEIIASKRHWIATLKSPDNARQRHVAITRANHSLQPFVAPLRDGLERRLRQLAERQRGEAILLSREYAFCLFPEQDLVRLLLDGGTQSP